MLLRVVSGLWWILVLALAALWLASLLPHAAHYVSTDRYCLILAADSGVAGVHYDGGPDVLGLQTARSLQFAGAKLDVMPGRWDRIDARLPLWMPTVVLVLSGLTLWFLAGRRARHRRKLGLCLKCGYDLRGNTTGRCSECGTPIVLRGRCGETHRRPEARGS